MGTTEDDDTRARIDREAILARRRRFVAATLTGLTTSTLATACPCLNVAPASPSAEPDAAAGDMAQPEDAAQDDGDPAEDVSPQEGEAEQGGEGDGAGAGAGEEAEPGG